MFEILGFSASRFSQIVPSCPLTTEVFGGDNALTSFTSSRKTPSHNGRLSLGVVVVLAAQGVGGAEDGEVGDHEHRVTTPPRVELVASSSNS